jgi:hypothetical protein
MDFFNSVKAKLGVGKPEPLQTIAKALKLAFANDADQKAANEVLEILLKRLNGHVGNSPVDWERADMAPLWKAEPELRGNYLATLVKAFPAIVPANRGNLSSYVFSFTTVEGLGSLLEGDIWFAIAEIMKRKTTIDDNIASQIASRIMSHYQAKNLNILNSVIGAGTNPTFKATRDALKKLQIEIQTENYPANFIKKAKLQLAKLFPDLDSRGDVSSSFPEVRWITWQSTQRVKEYLESSGGEEIPKSFIERLEALKKLVGVNRNDEHHRRFIELRTKMEQLKVSGQMLSSSEQTELGDLSGHGDQVNDFVRSMLWSEFQELIVLAKILAELNPGQRELWKKWKALSYGIIGKSGPSKAWLESVSSEIKGFSKQVQAKFLQTVLQDIEWPSRLAAGNSETLRAAIYGSIHLPADSVCGLLANFAGKQCFVTVPQIGIRNEKLGNACLWTLINRKKGEGIPYLSRLQLKIKYPKVKTRIGTALDDAAKAAGTTRGALEEKAFRDFGLDANGERILKVGEGNALIRIAGSSKVEVSWRVGEGKFSETPPAKLKSESKKIKEIRALAKDIVSELSANQVRLQRIWLDNRSWSTDEWLESYGRHPVMSQLARRLIWIASANGEQTPFIFRGGKAENLEGEPVAIEGVTITLWHPVLRAVKEVLAWRKRLSTLAITQPFKQAHREVYLVTPAELGTDTYSNRFAGHILKQHQMVALARLNGWNITHRIAADAPNDAPTHLVIPAYGLVAEYWTEAAGGDGAEFNDAGAYLYLSTDQLRFYKIADSPARARSTAYGPSRGEAVSIKDVPKIVLSEVMRHCDLFVGVASVANDPNWRDSGANAGHPNQWRMTAGAEYWQNQSFGELDQSSETRREFLNEILPALEVGKVSRIEGRFLHVEGKLTSYKIHLGSGNILMEPNDRYLCIVPSRQKTELSETKSLPFEGDAKLSLILSKAILLAADEKITDQSILMQIGRK